MPTLKQIREALKTTLATIDGLRAFDYVPGGVSPPAAVVKPPQITYGTTLNEGSHDLVYGVLVLVSLATDRTAQDTLEAYLDPSSAESIAAVIAADPTLGGVVDYAVVTVVQNTGNVMFGDAEYFGAEVLVNVGVS